MEKGRIISFATFMTGEVFGVLRQHSILGRTMQSGEIDEGGFRRGVAAAAKGGGALLHGLFGARTLSLFGELAEREGAGYLSGLLIGTELLEAPRVARHFRQTVLHRSDRAAATVPVLCHGCRRAGLRDL